MIRDQSLHEVPSIRPVAVSNSAKVVSWRPADNWLWSMLSQPAEVWRYRELLAGLVARDVKLRYRGTVFGFLWCLINPLLMTLIFTLLFTVFMPNTLIPSFPVFALVGVLAWNFHASSIMGAIQSITSNSALLAKTYFPRELLPLSVVISNGVNFLFALPVLVAFLLFFGVGVGWSLILFPAAVVIQMLFLAGFALILATMNVFYRDTAIILESLLLAWFFLTPIFYRPEDLFPEWQRLLYIVNPVASIVAIYRDILYAKSGPDPLFVLRAFAEALGLFLIGWGVFQRFSDRFVEEL
jgi:lipopolysaccharide transport system permease protein